MFLKYILKNVKEKKIRLVLVILSIAVTSALLYITLFSNRQVKLDTTKALNTEYGDTDFIVTSSSGDNPFLDKISDSNIKSTVNLLWFYGLYNYKNTDYDVDLIGIKSNERGKNVDYSQIKSDGKFKNATAIITESSSKRYGLKTGDYMTIKINGTKSRIKIVGISKNQGLQYNESGSIKILIPFDYANEIISQNSKSNTAYITLKKDSSDERAKTLTRLKKKYSQYKFTTIDSSLVKNSINSNLAMPLLIILIVTSIMSAIIIYSTSNIVILERMPVIGTFLSVGMTNFKISLTLLVEALVEGLSGGVIGFGAGIIGAQVLTHSVNVNFMYGIIGILFACVVSVLSVLIAVLKLRSIPIKEIILDIRTVKVSKKNLSGIFLKVGIPVMIFVIAIIFNGTLIESIAVIVGTVIVLALDLPLVLRFISSKCIRFLRNRFSFAYIAIKNICTTVMLINNMYLIIITLTVTLLIGTISSSVIAEFNDMYKGYNSDISMSIANNYEDIHDYIKKDNQIEKAYYFYMYENMKVNKDHSSISLVEGVDLDTFTEYNTYFSFTGGKNTLKKLKSSNRDIILSLALLKRYNKKVGDTIELFTDDDKKLTYHIVGSVNAKMANMGSVAIISIDNMKKDFSIKKPNSVGIKLKKGIDSNSYYMKIKRSNIAKKIEMISIDSIKKKQDISMTQSFLNTINGVSIMTIILATIGVLNNIVISFIQRRKIFATYDSIGINKTKKKLVMFMESIFMYIVCILFSFLLYTIFIKNCGGILAYIGVYLEIKFNLKMFAVYSFIVLIDILVSSLIVQVKLDKLSIINELKYE
ncbi:ABC transporter permease [Clostridium felsineum]|uniref:ABC transporter permease n=1 Tax=Clostridium felsineum TaxID=36839 RepID=UPI00098C9303|nr:FtsX-like permease family protein [Clostridium felsineum]URZ01276.1 hypothetical protein CLAUR_012650 [Clostridium felsineum]